MACRRSLDQKLRGQNPTAHVEADFLLVAFVKLQAIRSSGGAAAPDSVSLGLQTTDNGPQSHVPRLDPRPCNHMIQLDRLPAAGPVFVDRASRCAANAPFRPLREEYGAGMAACCSPQSRFLRRPRGVCGRERRWARRGPAGAYFIVEMKRSASAMALFISRIRRSTLPPMLLTSPLSAATARALRLCLRNST